MDIYMDSNETEKLADEMISSLEEFNDNIKKMNDIVDNINGAWQGDDATRYINSMKEKNIPELKRLYGILLNYSCFLRNVPNAYQILDEVFTSRGIDF